MRIGIIGLGLIGASLAKAFKNNSLYVWGIDKDDNAIEDLRSENIIDKGYSTIEEAKDELKESDFIFICVYPSMVKKILESIKPYLKEDQIVIDSASTKQKIVFFANKDPLLTKVFIGGHPLAGKENSGYKNSSADLFRGKIFFLVPSQEVTFLKIDKAKELIESIGARAMITTPIYHDITLAYISHLPQIIAYILADTSINRDRGKTFGTGFKDTTRIAKSPVPLWLDIIKENKTHILKSMRDFYSNFIRVYNAIEKEEWEELEKIFKTAREKRLKIEEINNEANKN
ncbi:MAG: prephenate dehydrogenase [Dictyoglomus sp. NZ13-RE01]|nr:MAG: prephenate dehydrogenase [Dictyoglomus sp. NZ13-RE01]